MVLSRSCLVSAVLAALLAAAGGPEVHAMFAEERSIIHEDPSLKPICISNLGDHDIFFIDHAPECKTCTSARAKERCRHRHATLVNLHYLADKGRWSCSRLSRPLPASAAWMGRGGGNTLLLADGEELSRLHLVREGSSWKVVRSETVIPWLWLAKLTGGATVYPTFAVTPDRSVVVGLDRSVVLLPPDLTMQGPGAAKWLLGRPPTPVDPRAGAGPGGTADPDAGMLVAVGDDGRVLVLDQKTRGILAIAPDTGDISRVARADQWPLEGFVPVDLAAAGRQLFVYGHAGASPLARAYLVGLVPGAKGDPSMIGPAIETIRSAPFTFTPLGHMALADCFNGRIWFFPNSAVKPAVREDADEQKAARAAADAAYSALVQEAEAEAAAAREASRTETKVETRDPEPEPERPARPAPAPRAPAAVMAGAGKPEAKTPSAKQDDSGFRRYPSGHVNQVKIAQMTAALAASARFGETFNDWAARQRSRHPVRVAGLAERVAPADRSVPLAVPATPPAGLARFTLREAALRRVVKWMLLNADRANHPDEVARWRAQGGRGKPLFAFGMYENNRCPQVILELSDLRAVAGRIDGLGGDAGTSVAGQLDAVDGIVGVCAPKDGPARFCYGLTLVLGEGNRSIAAIHPGGSWAVEHPWSGPAGKAEAAEAEPPAPAPAPAAQAAAPVARPKSRLNPLAPEFVMPGS